jgi:hypothetical protein
MVVVKARRSRGGKNLPTVQFCCETKTALKIKSLLKLRLRQ